MSWPRRSSEHLRKANGARNNSRGFIDPTTGQRIETSNQFTHNWVSSDGSTAVLNGDPTYDPNGVMVYTGGRKTESKDHTYPSQFESSHVAQASR